MGHRAGRSKQRSRMSAVKEAMARLANKIRDIAWINPDYITRQVDVYPARFGKGSQFGYRQPAPANISKTGWERPNIPTTAPGRSKFNIRYFDRDGRRAPDTVLTIGTNVKMIASSEEAAFGESGVLATTGLHTIPTHLPGPTWRYDAEAIVKDLEAKGLPPVPGKAHRFRPG